jgi:hypothetical protein
LVMEKERSPCKKKEVYTFQVLINEWNISK